MGKKKTIFICSCLALGSLACSAIVGFIANSNSVEFLKGEGASSYSLTLKEGTVSFPSSFGALTFSGKTDASSYPVSFSATSVKSVSGGFGLFESGSTLKNNDAITGVNTVLATFSGSLSVQYGFTPTTLASAVSLTSGSAYNFPETMNYFVFSVAGDTTINQIVFNYSCSLRTAEGDSLIEAENCTSNNTGNYKGNALAHGGAYVGSLNDAGQGVRLTYYAYEAGTRPIDVYYTTGSVGSYHGIYVNGTYQSRFTYSTNTGWGSTSAYNAAKASASVTLTSGWNTIDVIKCGTSSDSPSYGGWAELDYFVLHGLGHTYDPSTYTAPTSYRFEAEQGYIHSASTAPATSSNASLGYIASGINATGQGVDFSINVPSGNYQLKVSTGTTSSSSVATFNTDENASLNAKIALTPTSGWTDTALNAASVNISFTASGAHTLKLTRESDSDWFTVDYVLLAPIG